ncbi:MAG: ferredoxin [Candidatus Eisenbacteria bacterium]|nr:ferredoxin [Candidatus Eisenbacteria bacterium]
MRAVVDQDTCTGCGLCIETAPGVYSWDDDKAKAIEGRIPEDQQDAAKQGADDCPVDAIEIKED